MMERSRVADAGHRMGSAVKVSGMNCEMGPLRGSGGGLSIKGAKKRLYGKKEREKEWHNMYSKETDFQQGVSAS